ncbi:MAG: hypothetical protein SPI12_03990 [Actinomycetaceae bacterium]|nr:hypothetical protein [Actinomycetaceae bacterium]MDY6083006.1 hypothetical protein [Actinomycetaceae bacterium]
MELLNFDHALIRGDFFYGGDGGAKLAIEYEGDVWMLKFPKSTRGRHNPHMSYTTSPLSEYLGSQIYAALNIPVHQTVLGIRAGKVVVACKDFTFEKGRETARLIPFNEIKNAFMSSDLDSYCGSGSDTLLEEVLATIAAQPTLTAIPGVTQRFWDMFIVDALIGNNDRDNGNWGILRDNATRKQTLAPVFDNGNAFFSKRGIDQIIDAVPEEFEGIRVMPAEQKYFYKQVVALRVSDVFELTVQALKKDTDERAGQSAATHPQPAPGGDLRAEIDERIRAAQDDVA